MSRIKNVVMIVTDSWQYNYTGCYGNDWIRTPNVDELAREGTVFENAYAEGLPTIPVRRALATGRFTLPFAGWVNLTGQETTVADICYRNHIQSALIADCPMLHLEKYIYSRGFDYVHFIRGQEGDHHYGDIPVRHLNPMDFHKPVMDPTTGQEADVSRLTLKELRGYLAQRQYWKTDADQHAARTTRAAVDYLERVVDRSRPFYLWLDYFDPHEPWDPPSVYDRDLPCPYDPDYKGKQLILPVPTMLTNGYENAYTEEELHHIRMLFAEKTTMTDKWVGVLLQRLKDLGLYDNTLIVWLSDHGEPLGHGEHGHGIMRKCRPWPYEELVHVPMVIRHPDLDPQRISSFVQNMDLAPTILDFLGVKDPVIEEEMQGKSMLPLMSGEVESIRDFVIAGYHNFSWSIYTKDWSFVHWLHDGEFKDAGNSAVVFYGDLLKQMIPDLYKEALSISGEDAIWSCTPGAKAETPTGDELYFRKEDPFQLKNVVKDEPKTANDLWITLRDHMLGLKAS